MNPEGGKKFVISGPTRMRLEHLHGASQEQINRIEEICQHTNVAPFRVWELLKFVPPTAVENMFKSLERACHEDAWRRLRQEGRSVVNELRKKVRSEEELGRLLAQRYTRKRWL